MEREPADLVKMNMDERIRVTEEYEQRLAQEVDEAEEQQRVVVLDPRLPEPPIDDHLEGFGEVE